MADRRAKDIHELRGELSARDKLAIMKESDDLEDLADDLAETYGTTEASMLAFCRYLKGLPEVEEGGGLMERRHYKVDEETGEWSEVSGED